MRKILISYRRSDSDAITGRIRDRLSQHYGEESVFMDIDSIPLGIDFRRQIQDALLDNELLIAVVGPKWLGPTEDGRLRIHDEADPVRIEVETAIARGIPTIPVLVGGATMPKPGDLPDSLKNFSFYNAAAVDSGLDFRQHMERLIRSTDMILTSKSRRLAAGRKSGSLRAWLPAGLAACLVGLVGAGVGFGWPRISAWLQPRPPAAQTASAAPSHSPPPPSRTPQAPQPAQAPPPASQAASPQPVPVAHYASAMAAALACEAGTAPLDYENWGPPDPGWRGLYADSSGGGAAVVDGAAVLTPRADNSWTVVHQTSAFLEASTCVRVQSPPAQKYLDAGGGGILFWGTDAANLYAVYLAPEGSYGIERRVNGTTYTIAGLTRFDAIKPGLGAVNQIKLTARENTITIVFNGVKARDFQATPPKEGSYAGLVAWSEESQSNAWKFIDFTIVAPNYADELTNFGVPPQSALQSDVGSQTPTTLPGASVLRTGLLNDAKRLQSLDGSPFLLIDVLNGTHGETIAGARRLDYAGSFGTFTDAVQQRLTTDLAAATKNDLAMPLVFFCRGARCWESYNAALRALKIGYTHVYWYRGGLDAWAQAGLPFE
jgi:PQQ-dependent catabolism-associated CXXCW motif protein